MASVIAVYAASYTAESPCFQLEVLQASCSFVKKLMRNPLPWGPHAKVHFFYRHVGTVYVEWQQVCPREGRNKEGIK